MAPDLHHERFGEGPPLVAIHGLGSNLRVWRPIREQVGRHHELIGVDLPGFGESKRPVGRRGVRPLVDAIEAWLDEQGLQQPHLTGYSMGGRIVLELAGRGRAASVTAISPAGLQQLAREAPDPREPDDPASDHPAGRAQWPTSVLASAPGRTALLTVAVARPWQLTPDQAANMVRDFAWSLRLPRGGAATRCGASPRGSTGSPVRSPSCGAPAT